MQSTNKIFERRKKWWEKVDCAWWWWRWCYWCCCSFTRDDSIYEHYSGTTLALDCLKIFYVLLSISSVIHSIHIPTMKSQNHSSKSTYTHRERETHSQRVLLFIVTNVWESNNNNNKKKPEWIEKTKRKKIHETRTNWLEVVDCVARRINALLLSYTLRCLNAKILNIKRRLTFGDRQSVQNKLGHWFWMLWKKEKKKFTLRMEYICETLSIEHFGVGLDAIIYTSLHYKLARREIFIHTFLCIQMHVHFYLPCHIWNVWCLSNVCATKIIL